MKRNFLRLCLMLGLLSLNSCRQDIIPEQETYNNSGAFQLTSKRISLNEAKHKAKLIPELEKAETEIKAKTKSYAHGKLVDFGNGMMINTDDVIYTENGPNYHTYTFNIIRENTSTNVPVENLLLTPNEDGSYRVFHIVLNLSEADKNKIANREFVDYKNKEQITELANVNLSSLSQKRICIPHYYSYAVPCKENLHQPGEPCAYEGTSGAAYWGGIVLYDCFGEVDETITPTDPGGPSGGGGGPGGGEGNNPGNPPNDCIDAATNPNQVGIVNPNGCNTGIPTEPNLPNLGDDPCRKTKASITAANNVLSSTAGQSMDTFLKGKINAENEWNVGIEQTSTGLQTTPPKEGTKSNSTPNLSNLTGTYIGNGHSHSGDGGQPSGGDMYAIWERFQIFPNHKYSYVYGNYFGNAEVYALIVDDPSLLTAFFAKFPKSENYDEQNHSIRRDSPLGSEFYKAWNHASEGRSDNTSGEYYEPRAVAMAYILEKNNSGISIAKADANGKLKKINATVQQITVSGSGAVKEGVKISKCP